VLIAGLAGSSANNVAAQIDSARQRGFSATLSLLAQRDSNIFRLPDGSAPSDVGLSGTQRSDRTLSPGVTIEAVYPYARQDFYARLGFYWNRFAEFDDYDTNSLTYRLGWTWRTAEEFSGELLASRDQSNTSFQDFLGPTRNVLTLYSERAAVNWQPRPDRRFSASIDYFTGRNSTAVRSLNDFNVASLQSRVTAISPLGNELYLSYVGTSGDYPNRLDSEALAIDNSYWQGNFNLGGVWNTTNMRIEARGGYLVRRFDSITARNFAKPVWLFNAAWAPTSKTSLGLSYVRDLTSIEDLDRAYTVSTTAILSLRYQVTPRVGMSAQYFRQDVEWAGDPQTFLSRVLPPDTAVREDRYTTPRLSIDWTPARRWQVSASQEWPSRGSNRNGLEFDSSVSTIAVQYTIGP
jgi:hypothetical protein